MRNTFIGYYRPSDEDLKDLWENCTFVLDANVLLNLYRYSPDTTSELLKILHKISNRIWVPHQAAFEYQKRRLEVILQQEQSYDEALNFSKKSSGEIKNKLLSSKHPFVSDAAKITKKLDKLFSEIEEKLNESKSQCVSIIDEDFIREKLTNLLDGKVGAPYDTKKYAEIHNAGKDRYDKKIPPGYEDQKNKDNGREYGDLIFWLQTLDYAKETQNPIVLITDEKKEDWWLKSQGKIIGPRPELVKEIKDYSGVPFYMYRVDPFMVHALKFLKQRINPKAINEVRETRYRDDEKLAALNTLPKAWEEYARNRELAATTTLSASLESMYSKNTLREMAERAELLRKELAATTTLSASLESMYSKNTLREMAERAELLRKIVKNENELNSTKKNKISNKNAEDSSTDPDKE
jgi:predicted nucleic acid-binding protein